MFSGAGAISLGSPLVATTSEGNLLLVGVLSSVSDTLSFADVGAKRAWILATSGNFFSSLLLSSLELSDTTIYEP